MPRSPTVALAPSRVCATSNVAFQAASFSRSLWNPYFYPVRYYHGLVRASLLSAPSIVRHVTRKWRSRLYWPRNDQAHDGPIIATSLNRPVQRSNSICLCLPISRTSRPLVPSLLDVVVNIRRMRRFLLLLSIAIILPIQCLPLRRLFSMRSIAALLNPSFKTLHTSPFAAIYPLTVTAPSPSQQPPPKNLVVVALILFVVSAALASAETAITTLWPWKVRELAEKEGPKSPFSALQRDLTRFLTTILVSTTTATVFSTAIATELAGHIFGPAAVAYVTAALTVIFLFLGEILPKALAVHAPAKVARLMVPVISLLSIIVYPVGKLLAWFSTQILRLLKLPMESDANVSEEELRLIVTGADRSGSIEKHESQIIHNVLDLEDTDVSEVMCPRVDVVAIAADESLTKFLEMEMESHYSRLPVFHGSVDNIVGVAMTKSLLRFLTEDSSLLNQTKVSEIMDPAFFVPESMSVWVALEEMRRRRLHMAIVVDEYGGTAGLVTLEDILEEVVGEIYDEDDDYEAESSLVRKGKNGELLIEGQAELDRVCEELKLQVTEDDLHDYGTISGFLCALMGGIPLNGDKQVFQNVRFTVMDADDRRIRKVRAEVLTSEEMAQIQKEAEATTIKELGAGESDETVKNREISGGNGSDEARGHNLTNRSSGSSKTEQQPDR